jgi:Dual specificity phosphatase, catalytic domain
MWQVDLPDVESSNLLSHLPGCIDFITRALAGGGKVLVHCAAGVSRSTTVRCSHVKGLHVACALPMACTPVASACTSIWCGAAAQVQAAVMCRRCRACNLCAC